MEEDKSLQVSSNTDIVDASTSEVIQKIVDEDNIDKLREYIQLFNINQMKKDVIRAKDFGTLMDKVKDQMIERFDKKPGEFTNTDLLNYLSATQNAIDRTHKSISTIEETPAISLMQNNQVNINIASELGNESRTRIISAIQDILKRGQIRPEEKEPAPIQEIEHKDVVDENPVTSKRKRGRPRKEVKNDE